MKESRSGRKSRRARWSPRSAWLEQLETRHLLAAVPFGDQELVDQLDADGPASVAASDVDGDGDLDLVIASYRDGHVAWHENDGDGVFAKHLIAVVDGQDVTLVREVVAADFDGDGDEDVAVAAYGSDRVIWYRNLDQGQFDSGQIVSTETNGVRTIAAADLDADGDFDLISGSWFDDKVAWYENDGAGGFGQQQIISTATDGPRHLRVGDINKDGRPDIAVASRLDDTVSWFANQGNGNFGNQRTLPTTNNGPEAIALADADGDDDLDLFLASYWDGTIAWFENEDGNGNFGGQQDLSTTANRGQFVAVADIDGDGDNDLIATSYYDIDNKTTWFENTDGDGTFSSEKLISDESAGAESLAIADLDGDNTLDVVIASVLDNRVTWFANDGNASFSLPHQVLADAPGTGSVATADFDGDGDLDILAGSYWDDEVAWYENVDGQGNYAQQRVITNQARRVQAVRAVDLDGDDDMDVISASYRDNKIAWYENVDGQGNFGPQQIITRQSVGAINVHAADLDGDGDLDVLSASALDSIIAWYENEDGLGTFGTIQVLTRRAISAEWVTSADLDDDGDTDVISASFGDGRVAWFENEDGQGTFGGAQTITTGGGTTAVEATDVDGDGDLDLVATQYDLRRLVWFEQTDPKVFGEAQVISEGLPFVESLFIADVDGNGTDDIVTAADTFVVWFERVDAEFVGRLVTSGNVDRVFEVAVADVDGDSDMDILSASFFDSKIALYRNQDASGDFDGDGVVDEADLALLCAAIHGPSEAALFDLNADGTIDDGDLKVMIEDILQTSAGDANLDGVFNSRDLVLVFQAGHYEDDLVDNSFWTHGDWNCDGEFDSSDLVEAFKAGRYEASATPRSSIRADLAAAVLALDGDEATSRRRQSP